MDSLSGDHVGCASVVTFRELSRILSVAIHHPNYVVARIRDALPVM